MTEARKSVNRWCRSYDGDCFNCPLGSQISHFCDRPGEEVSEEYILKALEIIKGLNNGDA